MAVRSSILNLKIVVIKMKNEQDVQQDPHILPMLTSLHATLTKWFSRRKELGNASSAAFSSSLPMLCQLLSLLHAGYMDLLFTTLEHEIINISGTDRAAAHQPYQPQGKVSAAYVPPHRRTTTSTSSTGRAKREGFKFAASPSYQQLLLILKIIDLVARSEPVYFMQYWPVFLSDSFRLERSLESILSTGLQLMIGGEVTIDTFHKQMLTSFDSNVFTSKLLYCVTSSATRSFISTELKLVAIAALRSIFLSVPYQKWFAAKMTKPEGKKRWQVVKGSQQEKILKSVQKILRIVVLSILSIGQTLINPGHEESNQEENKSLLRSLHEFFLAFVKVLPLTKSQAVDGDSPGKTGSKRDFSHATALLDQLFFDLLQFLLHYYLFLSTKDSSVATNFPIQILCQTIEKLVSNIDSASLFCAFQSCTMMTSDIGARNLSVAEILVFLQLQSRAHAGLHSLILAQLFRHYPQLYLHSYVSLLHEYFHRSEERNDHTRTEYGCRLLCGLMGHLYEEIREQPAERAYLHGEAESLSNGFVQPPPPSLSADTSTHSFVLQSGLRSARQRHTQLSQYFWSLFPLLSSVSDHIIASYVYTICGYLCLPCLSLPNQVEILRFLSTGFRHSVGGVRMASFQALGQIFSSMAESRDTNAVCVFDDFSALVTALVAGWTDTKLAVRIQAVWATLRFICLPHEYGDLIRNILLNRVPDVLRGMLTGCLGLLQDSDKIHPTALLLIGNLFHRFPVSSLLVKDKTEEELDELICHTVVYQLYVIYEQIETLRTVHVSHKHYLAQAFALNSLARIIISLSAEFDVMSISSLVRNVMNRNCQLLRQKMMVGKYLAVKMLLWLRAQAAKNWNHGMSSRVFEEICITLQGMPAQMRQQTSSPHSLWFVILRLLDVLLHTDEKEEKTEIGETFFTYSDALLQFLETLSAAAENGLATNPVGRSEMHHLEFYDHDDDASDPMESTSHLQQLRIESISCQLFHLLEEVKVPSLGSIPLFRLQSLCRRLTHDATPKQHYSVFSSPLQPYTKWTVEEHGEKEPRQHQSPVTPDAGSTGVHDWDEF